MRPTALQYSVATAKAGYLFYLNAEQHHRVNEKLEQDIERRQASGESIFTGRNLKPDHLMNESYFWNPYPNIVQKETVTFLRPWKWGKQKQREIHTELVK